MTTSFAGPVLKSIENPIEWALVRLRVAISVSLNVVSAPSGPGFYGVVEEDVYAVELILEAQVADAATVARIGTGGHVQAELLARQRGADLEAPVEMVRTGLTGGGAERR